MQALDNPFIFSLVAQLRNWQLGKHNWVTPSSDVVIEGYPRSANTFLHRIVRAATDCRLRIGNHVHRPQQITMSLSYDIPCFVLFRHPLDCISSYLVREPSLTAQGCLEDYLRFADIVLARADHPRLFILNFEEVIAAPSSVTSNILAQIGHPTEITDELIADATQDKRADRTRRSLPTPEKEALKQKHLISIEALPDYEKAIVRFQAAKALAWHR